MSGREPVWLEQQALIVLHDRTLALHGGPSGVRDQGLLESALQRPRNHFHYEGETDLYVLAATSATGIAANHPFVDGNKRAAFQAMILFLALNGRPLRAEKVEAIRVMFAVAAGEIGTDDLADWLRRNTAG